MVIGRLRNGRPYVAYENVDEVIDKGSCLGCMYYSREDVCVFYAECRAEKDEDEYPSLFSYAGIDAIQDRFLLKVKES